MDKYSPNKQHLTGRTVLLREGRTDDPMVPCHRVLTMAQGIHRTSVRFLSPIRA